MFYSHKTTSTRKNCTSHSRTNDQEDTISRNRARRVKKRARAEALDSQHGRPNLTSARHANWLVPREVEEQLKRPPAGTCASPAPSSTVCTWHAPMQWRPLAASRSGPTFQRLERMCLRAFGSLAPTPAQGRAELTHPPAECSGRRSGGPVTSKRQRGEACGAIFPLRRRGRVSTHPPKGRRALIKHVLPPPTPTRVPRQQSRRRSRADSTRCGNWPMRSHGLRSST